MGNRNSKGLIAVLRAPIARIVSGMFVVMCLFTAPVTIAQDNTAEPVPVETVRAGVYVSPPFVMRTDDGFGGMAIELWNGLTAERSIESEFIEYPTVKDLIDAVAARDVDVGLSNITINEARAQRIDFTQPWFDAGLQVMISDAPRSGFTSVIDGLSASGHLEAYAWIVGLILMATVVLTLFDRRFDKNYPKRWREGLAEGFYTVMSVATSGKPPSRAHLFGWVGRIFSALWLVCGIAVLAYVTSSVTSVMTTLALEDRVSGVGDLVDRDVGVLAGSTGEEYATSQGLRVRRFEDIDNAATALEAGRIDAVVGDAPVLDYYAHNTPGHQVRVVGEIFAPEKYGFAIARDSPLARPITIDLLGADEAGAVEALRLNYFGPRQ